MTTYDNFSINSQMEERLKREENVQSTDLIFLDSIISKIRLVKKYEVFIERWITKGEVISVKSAKAYDKKLQEVISTIERLTCKDVHVGKDIHFEDIANKNYTIFLECGDINRENWAKEKLLFQRILGNV